MRCFVVIGQTASASPGFLLGDIPGTSGRLDLLLRCVRAALLVSHGVRRDTRVYLVLLGGPDAPRTIRIDGATAAYVRPDERSLAGRVQKALGMPKGTSSFFVMRNGFAIAEGGLDAVLADLSQSSEGATFYVLDEAGADIRSVTFESCRAGQPLDDHRAGQPLDDHRAGQPLDDHRAGQPLEHNCVFFVGDHLGFDEATRARITAKAISVGPVSVHADDAITLVNNELDRG